MGKHNDKSRYPVKALGTGDYIVGENGSTGETVNFDAEAIFAGDFDQDNIRQFVFTKLADGDSILDAINAIDTGVLFEVAEKDLMSFRVRRRQNVTTKLIPTTNEKFFYDYYRLVRSGAGTYGTGGNIELEAYNLELYRTTEIASVTSSNNEKPIVFTLRTEDITISPENILNNYSNITGYTITNDADFYFEIEEVVDNLIPAPKFTGNYALYRFVGDPAIYGADAVPKEIAVANDFIEVGLVDDSGAIANDFVGLNDVYDNAYSIQKLGYAALVTVDPNNQKLTAPVPSEPDPDIVLKLTKIPLFTDLYKENAVFNKTIKHISGLTYKFSAKGFIINGVLYEDAVSKEITLSDGNATNPRYDVIAIRLTESLTTQPTFDIVVLEGTPAVSPIKLVVNSLVEAEFTFRRIGANQVTELNVTTEKVFGENTGQATEWTNLFLIAGGLLADPTDPSTGTTSFTAPAAALAVGLDNRVSWIDDVKTPFNPEDLLLFDLQTDANWGVNSSIQIKLIDSADTTKFFTINLTPSVIGGFGFDTTVFEYQQVEIPFFNLIPNSVITQYDTIEFGFVNVPQTRLDEIYIQGGLSQAPDPELRLLDRLKDVPATDQPQTIDWMAYETWVFIQTAAIIFTEVNPPPVGFTKTITVYVDGAFQPVMPVGWTIKSGIHDTAKDNQYVVEWIKAGKVWVDITN